MDKTEFLKMLKQDLVVLNEGEQKDILDEYAQHIDMKMERGMSETEAIREFGDIGELASEILEAYHVNPQFGARKHPKMSMKEEIPVTEIAKTGKKYWFSTVGFFKKICKKTASGLARLWQVVKKPFQYLGELGKQQDSNGKQSSQLSYKECPMTDGDGGRRKNMFGKVPGILTRGIRKLFLAAFYLTMWCIRWGWNLFLLMIAGMTGMVMLGCLFVVGLLAVLLIQGYPLTGILLGSFGMVLCSGALMVITCCLCRFGRKEQPAGTEVVQKAELIEGEVPEHA